MFEKKKLIINKETAEESFDQFCNDWEIDPENSDLTAEEQADFRAQKSKIVNAITKGRLVYKTESCSFDYIISEKSEKHKGKTISIKRPKGRTLRQADRAKEGRNVEKTYMILASMLGEDYSLCDDMDMVDLKPLLAISSLFLAS